MINNMQNIEIGINDFMNIKDNDDVVVIDIRSDIEPISILIQCVLFIQKASAKPLVFLMDDIS